MSKDRLLEELGGCGLFQYILCLLVAGAQLPAVLTYLVVEWSAYNLRISCMDNHRRHTVGGSDNLLDISDNRINFTDTESETSHENLTASHPEKVCHHKFLFDASLPFATTATSSADVTDYSWISAFIITVYIVGCIFGALLSGYIGDRFGRKIPLYSSMALHLVFTLISTCSVSWQMFAGIGFFLGVCAAGMFTLPVILVMEFVPARMRMAVGSIPVWPVGGAIFSLTAVVTPNLRYIYTIVIVLDAALLLGLFWVPESLRWIGENDSESKFLSVRNRIARMNKSQHASANNFEASLEDMKIEKKCSKDLSILCAPFRMGKTKSMCAIAFSFFSISVFYHAANFKVDALTSGTYIVMLLMSVAEIPTSVVAVVLGNTIGRRKSLAALFTFQAFSLLCAAFTKFLPLHGTDGPSSILVFLIVGKFGAAACWFVVFVNLVEMFPTAVRCTSASYGLTASLFGSLFAAFINLTRDADTDIAVGVVLTAMATAMLASGVLAVLFVPETQGRGLEDACAIDSSDERPRVAKAPKHPRPDSLMTCCDSIRDPEMHLLYVSGQAPF